MAVIKSIEVALPPYAYSNEEIREVGKIWLKDAPDKCALFERFVQASNTQQRTFVIPAMEVLALKGLAQRAQIFEEAGVSLGVEAVTKTLTTTGFAPATIGAQVFTSCSCPVIPSIDAQIIESCGLERTIQRAPVFQYGCAGGVAGLALADSLTKIHKRVLLTSVELCSLIFHYHDHSSAQLVGGAIFGDGATCVALEAEGDGLQIRASQSYLLPGTRHLMGYDLRDDGFHLRLDKALPSMLAHSVTERVDEFLSKHQLTRAEIGTWLFHPGGIKILDALERVLEIDPARATAARTVLERYGNLSSASVLLVLREYLERGDRSSGKPVVVLGIGPGLTLELILLRER
jgi:alkylresorcinol/alkylpyrone synthase